MKKDTVCVFTRSIETKIQGRAELNEKLESELTVTETMNFNPKSSKRRQRS